MGGTVVRFGLIFDVSIDPSETISSAPSITCKGVAWFYLSLTLVLDARGHAASSGHPRGPVVRRVPRQTDAGLKLLV